MEEVGEVVIMEEVLVLVEIVVVVAPAILSIVS